MKMSAFCIAVMAMALCAAGTMHAQGTVATVCEILKNPQSFNGKIVQIHATVRAGFDEFILLGDNCGQVVNGIWLAYPEGAKGKAGAAAVLEFQAAKNFTGQSDTPTRTPVQLTKDKEFKKFDGLLSTPFKGGGACLGCVKNEVNATLTGRLDASTTEMRRDGTGRVLEIGGFGHLNLYRAQLVLQSVTDVTAKVIDYEAKVKDVSAAAIDSSGSDNPVEGMRDAEKIFGTDSPASKLIERAAAAYGTPGQDNGVSITFGTNEENAKLEGVSASSSTDGVIYNCLFDRNRLKGKSLSVATAFDGAIIADLRSGDARAADEGTSAIEEKAYNVELLTAVALGAQAFTLPGGTVDWNAAWPVGERSTRMQGAIIAYIADQEVFHN